MYQVQVTAHSKTAAVLVDGERVDVGARMCRESVDRAFADDLLAGFDERGVRTLARLYVLQAMGRNT